MKIIRSGKIPWWVGIQTGCEKCRAILELEESDKLPETARTATARESVMFVCPECFNVNTIVNG